MTATSARLFWSLFVAAAIAIVVGANAHLVCVATTTQPGCAPHVKAGDQDGRSETYSAAASSC